MAQTAKPSGAQDLVNRLSDTIASNPRLSAAAAFQMGVLLGQVMQSSGALDGLKRTMAAAPEALASKIPTFGLFDSQPARSRRSGARAASRKPAAKRAAVKTRKRAARTSA